MSLCAGLWAFPWESRQIRFPPGRTSSPAGSLMLGTTQLSTNDPTHNAFNGSAGEPVRGARRASRKRVLAEPWKKSESSTEDHRASQNRIFCVLLCFLWIVLEDDKPNAALRQGPHAMSRSTGRPERPISVRAGRTRSAHDKSPATRITLSHRGGTERPACAPRPLHVLARIIRDLRLIRG